MGGQFSPKSSVRGATYYGVKCPGGNLLRSQVSGGQLTTESSVWGATYYGVKCPGGNLLRSQVSGGQLTTESSVRGAAHNHACMSQTTKASVAINKIYNSVQLVTKYTSSYT